MPTEPPRDVTQLLVKWQHGDEGALERLMPLVYSELRRLARRHMAGERGGHTLQATALVNEAYMRLVDVKAVQWQSRAHFLAMASRMMRRILVDAARARQSGKRGAGVTRVTLDEAVAVSDSPGKELVDLDDALNVLATVDPRKARVVELRVFGGLSVQESAEVLGVSADTVLRDWKAAKKWLLRELKGSSAESE